MSNTYWLSVQNMRLSRRRAMAATAGLGAGGLALSLIGCGGSDGDEASGTTKTAVAKPVDTTSQAKAGGVIKHFMTGEPAHFDVLVSANANVVNFVTPYAYPRLLKWTLGKYPNPAEGVPEGYAAESFEVSPDKLQVTFKLRQGMKWDSRAPTNNRTLDSQDVKFSWDKFGSINQLRNSLIYNATSAPLAPVEAISLPDSRTVTLKLRQPDVRILSLLVSWDTLNIMPREADGGFDPRKDVRGHGPWTLESYEPSVRMVYRKNPDFYIKDRPFPDRVEIPFVPDAAQRLAQFKAGNIYTNVALLADVIQTKKDVPQTVLQQGSNFNSAGGGYITFGWEGNSPWADARLRQAMSMVIDREAYADTIENRETFKKEGLDLPVKFNSIVYAGWTGAYLDPTDDKAFGPNNKYLKLNVAEAKKLVSAAGYANGLEFDWVYSTQQYGAEYLRSAELFAGMFPAAGFKPKQIAIPYAEYQQRYSDASYWKMTGVIMRAGRSWPSLEQNLFAFLHPSGSHYHGASTEGKAENGDPKLTETVLKIIGEFDMKRRNDIVHDLIKYYTQQTYSISRPSNTPGYNVTWPVIGNYGLNSTFVAGAVTDPWLHWWIDPSKPPLAKA